MKTYDDHREFDNANENLIFHRADPEEHWAFNRAHLISAAVFENKIKFQFPLHEVVVSVAEPEKKLARLLSGKISLLSATGYTGRHFPVEEIQIITKEFYR